MKHSKPLFFAILLQLTATPILAANSVDTCLVGNWRVDFETASKALVKVSKAPESKVFGTIFMEITAAGKGEFYVEDWSLRKSIVGKPDQEMLLDGSATFSVSAPTGGEFHFAELSNNYKQLIVVHKEGGSNPVTIDPIRQMQPMGDWAHGIWSCNAKTLKLTVMDQDPDGRMLTKWHRE